MDDCRHAQLPLIMKKAITTGIANALDAFEDDHLLEEEMKSDDKNVPEENWHNPFYEISDSNVEGFFLSCMVNFNKICKNEFYAFSTGLS